MIPGDYSPRGLYVLERPCIANYYFTLLPDSRPFTMAQVNGDVSTSSVFLQHLLDYPVIHDGVVVFQKNPYGQKSLQLSDTAYKNFAQPVLSYFAKPYELVRPYLVKADSFGDHALTKVDEKAPFVKKPTDELFANAKSLVLLPFSTGIETKDHVIKVYSAEVKKMGGEGVVPHGKAVLSTAFVATSEFLTWAGNVLHQKKDEAKQTLNEKTNNSRNN